MFVKKPSLDLNLLSPFIHYHLESRGNIGFCEKTQLTGYLASQFSMSVHSLPPWIKRKFMKNPSIPASLQYCLPSHVCLLGGTKSSLGMTSRHHEAVNKQEKELVHYYWELPRQKPTSFGGIKHGRGANWLFQINENVPPLTNSCTWLCL
jgi:hypothetical protein